MIQHGFTRSSKSQYRKRKNRSKAHLEEKFKQSTSCVCERQQQGKKQIHKCLQNTGQRKVWKARKVEGI
eukprot:6068847-Karenia_brevis.AAC.1